jgi:hypothetical protein
LEDTGGLSGIIGDNIVLAMTYFLLILIILILGLNAYLSFKALVLLNERQPEALKEKMTLGKADGENVVVMEWSPPESGEELAFREGMEKMKER